MGINSSLKQFVNNLFNQSEKNNADEKTLDFLEPVAANLALQYASDALNALQECARALHGFTNPKDISYYVMRTLREFYGADYVCVLEVNLDLDNWFLRWASREGDDTIEEDNSKGLIQPEEFTHYARSWIRAYRNVFPVLISNIDDIRDSDPEEYELYTRLEVKSVMGFPFYKNSHGFVVIRNPRNHFGEISLLQMCSYVLMMELNEYKMIQSLRLQAESYHITDESEIRLELFDGVKITHIGGQYKHENFSPEQRLVLTYMAIYQKTLSARGLENAIWDDCDTTQEGQKVRRAVHGIVRKCTLLKHPLITRGEAGYRFNPLLNIWIDVYEFMKMFDRLSSVSDVNVQKKILEDMIQMYKGPIRLEANAPAWMIQDQHYLESSYLTAVKRLLRIYFHEGNYEAVHRYAVKSMEIVPNNTEGYYWKLRVHRQNSRFDKANSLLETARKCLDEEDYQSLVRRLETMDDKDPEHIF